MNVDIDSVITAVKTAGKKIVELSGTAKVSQKGSSINLVTEADTMSELYLTKALKEIVPDSVVLGEEYSNKEDLSASKLWIIDPLDGTSNFAHGIPQFAVSVAYSESKVAKIGVVYDPLRMECFYAIEGEGAFMNEKKINVSQQTKLNESIIATGFYYDRGILMERTLLSIHRLFKANVRGIRRFGSAALDICWVANGRFEGYFEYQLAPWDFAAAQLIVSEAGGICCDQDGIDRGIYSKGLICSNGHIHQSLIELVKQREEYWK